VVDFVTGRCEESLASLYTPPSERFKILASNSQIDAASDVGKEVERIGASIVCTAILYGKSTTHLSGQGTMTQFRMC
jgi:hypothetical protein